MPVGLCQSGVGRSVGRSTVVTNRSAVSPSSIGRQRVVSWSSRICRSVASRQLCRQTARQSVANRSVRQSAANRSSTGRSPVGRSSIGRLSIGRQPVWSDVDDVEGANGTWTGRGDHGVKRQKNTATCLTRATFFNRTALVGKRKRI